MLARLRVLTGDSSGESIEVTQGKLVIGREVDYHLQRESPFISRHHCVLLLDDYTLRIRDLGSKNGTFVNGRRIVGGETILLDGDVVAVGEITFQVTLVLSLDGAQSTALGSPSAGAQSDLEATGGFADDTFHGLRRAVNSRYRETARN
jgi:pSer/pThr/pTyr-binding forkhead associated (FHA) protein